MCGLLHHTIITLSRRHFFKHTDTHTLAYLQSTPVTLCTHPTDRELQEATPELAARLKARQAAAERTQRLLSEEEEEAAAAASSSEPPGWSNSAAPFGGELAAMLRKR